MVQLERDIMIIKADCTLISLLLVSCRVCGDLCYLEAAHGHLACFMSSPTEQVYNVIL